MKILYISSFHAVLEYDELLVLTELGHQWFSTGQYLIPNQPLDKDNLRGPIKNIPINLELVDAFKKLNPNYKIHGPIYLSKEFVDNFDLVIAEHCCPYPFFLRDNWEILKHKPIIWRTYGQQNEQVELMTQHFVNHGNVKLVRVAETESKIKNFAGMDSVIKGYVDETRYCGWSGGRKEILTFNNFFNVRTYHSNTPIYRRIRKKLIEMGVETSLYGLYNDNVDINKGILQPEQQEQAYRDCSVYFALGSKPAPVTYSFAEALMTGTPTVTFGATLGTGDPAIYEVPTLVENGLHCFLSDSEEELLELILVLINNKELAKSMSVEARTRALQLFSKKVNKELWADIIERAVS